MPVRFHVVPCRTEEGKGQATDHGAWDGRWHDDYLAAIDAWRMAQDDRPNRAEALRRLVRMGLSQAVQKKRRRPPQQE